MNLEKLKHISIRIDEETLRKFHFVAKYDGRSASGDFGEVLQFGIGDGANLYGTSFIVADLLKGEVCDGG